MPSGLNKGPGGFGIAGALPAAGPPLGQTLNWRRSARAGDSGPAWGNREWAAPPARRRLAVAESRLVPLRPLLTGHRRRRLRTRRRVPAALTDLLQDMPELIGVFVAIIRALAHDLVDDVVQVIGQFRIVVFDPRNLALYMRQRQLALGAADVGQAPAKHLEEHNADGIDIGGRRWLFAPRLLRREVVRAAPNDIAARLWRGIGEGLGDAEIRDLHHIVLVDENVLRA